MAVVGHNNTKDNGQMEITTKGSTAGSTTAVGPNGTQYSAKVSIEGRNRSSTEDQIRSETISSSKVEFAGTIQAGTPCHTVDHEVNETDEGYTINMQTVKEAKEGQLCTQVVTGINYNAEFEAETGNTLEVQQNGETVETFQTVSDKGDKNKDKGKKSMVQQILNFLGL